MMDEQIECLLRLGDDALVLSQRLCAWVGKTPALEEDMALANTALDLLGQARMWLSLAGELEGAGRDEDRLAYGRDAHEYRNALLVEQPNGDYAQTLVRQYLFDTWHWLRLDSLRGSSDQRIADIAEKAVKEVTYHVRRSADLVVRLGDGSVESHERMTTALDELWMFTGELFVVDEVDELMEVHAIAQSVAELRDRWLESVSATLTRATLAMPSPGAWMQKGGRRGHHSEQLGYLLAEMQFLQRAYPGQQW